MVAFKARAGALPASYFFSLDSNFFTSCFSLLAKALESLQGVRPATSADAESTTEVLRAAARARAAAIFPAVVAKFSFFSAEQTVLADTCFTNTDAWVVANDLREEMSLPTEVRGVMSPAAAIETDAIECYSCRIKCRIKR